MIARHPEWGMESRNLLHLIDREKGTVKIDGVDYKMLDNNFPTIDPADPYKLTEAEAILAEKLVHSFNVSDKLRRHINVFFSHGCMYSVVNSNLLFHASMPMNEDGTLKEVSVRGKKFKGKDLLHEVGLMMRSAFNPDTPEEDRKYAIDYYWYLWCGPDSPLFDKAKMATFERYFLTDKEPQAEKKGHYYKLREDPKVCDYILDCFDVQGEHRHIINGHVPVKVGKGENPIKGDGKMMVIDGGFSKAYHNTTGIAGYTLVFHSRGFELVQHVPFTTAEDAVKNGTDILGTTKIVELNRQRMRVRDTDIGRELQGQIDELMMLLYAYRSGMIKERK